MMRGAAPKPASAAAPATVAVRRSYRTVSGCCQAILAHFGLDATHARTAPMKEGGDALRIVQISDAGDHVAMNILLPMPYGTNHMTVSTIGPPCITLPGMSLSSSIAAAALGQPIGRLTGHPAFDALDHLVVARVEAGHDGQGRPATMLHFEDNAEPLLSVAKRVTTSRSIH